MQRHRPELLGELTVPAPRHEAPRRPAARSTCRPTARPADPWARSLFLHERVPPPTSELTAEALAAAELEARRWQEASGADEVVFAERLASAGLDRARFVRLLAARETGAPPAPRAPRGEPWRGLLDEIRCGDAESVELPADPWRNPDGSDGNQPPFASFVRPFLQAGAARLRRGIAEIEGMAGAFPPLIATTAEVQFLRHLTELLVKHCGSTLILELHAARLRGQLRGATPGERWLDFSDRFFTRARVLATLEEYPVLARLLATTLCRWAEAHLEFLTRLAADRRRLAELGPAAGPMGTLASVTLGISDLHQRGRSVVIARDAEGHTVVYKPRALAVDAQMGRLLEAVNGSGLRHRLETARQLDRGHYGWQEYVESAPCEAPDELRRFYWRQGALLAVLHLVRGADFHHENLIARGEHPVLIDNEALFHHDLPRRGGDSAVRAEAEAEVRRSVIRQALLPFVYRLTGEGAGVESSGLGGAGGQVAPGSVRRWSDPATDQMRVVAADLVTREAQNRPSLRGERVSAAAFVAEIVAGFAEAYDLLAANRDRLRPLLDGFAGQALRFLLRPTRAYSVFLREGNHPNDLLDGLDRDALLDRLWAWGAAMPGLLPAIPFEHADLRSGDVPVFFSRPDSTHLWSSGGDEIEGFFAEPALRVAHRVLDGLSEADRERQILLIRLTLSETRPSDAAYERREPAAVGPAPRREAGGAAAAAAELHAAAVGVGKLLKRRALIGRRGVCWISMEPLVDDGPGGERPRNVTLAGDDLYHGGAGIALFLAQLGDLAGDAEASELARGTLRGLLETRRTDPVSRIPVVGAYLGRAGLVYTLLHLAALWSEPALLDEALADLPAIEELVPADRELDVLGGSAGCALVLLQLHWATGDGAALRAARACGDHLLRQAQTLDVGLAWTGASFGRPVAGLSHGAAGIAWALAELAAATGDERYLQAAARAIAFERGLLAAGDGDDFHSRVSWCHGPPSVALGRMVADSSLRDPGFGAEVATGAESILAAPPPADACLCHGALGNAEILLAAARHCGRPEWEESARSAAAAAGRRVQALDRDLLLPLHGRFAGLLCGLAGIGWGLLRFAHGDRVPCVLTLDPPRRR